MTNAEATITRKRRHCRGTGRGTKKEAKAGKKADKPAHAKEASTPRREQGAKILEMIGRSNRVTLAQIVKATD